MRKDNSITTRGWSVLGLALALLCAASIALVWAVRVNSQERASVDRRICVAVNKVNTTIETTLHRSLKTLPTITYYKEHPDELVQQIALVRQEITEFKPLKCKGF